MNVNIFKYIIREGLPAYLPKLCCLPRNAFCASVTQDVSADQPVGQVAASASDPIIVERQYNTLRRTSEEIRQAWLETLTSPKDDKVGLVSLHPDIFAAVPRMDIIHENVVWQMKYKDINYRHAKVPVEMRGPGKGYGRKPWPQKGTGRARHGSTRGPQWVKGGTVHGPRRFTTQFFMLPFGKRLQGLIYTLSCKFAQDDLKIVTSLEIPSTEGSYLEELVEERCWGDSVLFVDVEDVMPENITTATDQIPHFNLLPVYGLNVHSMLKHDTLILTLAAAEKIQERLLYHVHNPEFLLKS